MRPTNDPALGGQPYDVDGTATDAEWLHRRPFGTYDARDLLPGGFYAYLLPSLSEADIDFSKLAPEDPRPVPGLHPAAGGDSPPLTHAPAPARGAAPLPHTSDHGKKGHA